MKSSTETYVFGRFLVRFGTAVGWFAAAVVASGAVFMVITAKSGVAYAVLVSALVLGAMSHGFWQLVGAVFDIADDVRTTRELAQDATRAERREAFERKATDGGR